MDQSMAASDDVGFALGLDVMLNSDLFFCDFAGHEDLDINLVLTLLLLQRFDEIDHELLWLAIANT